MSCVYCEAKGGVFNSKCLRCVARFLSTLPTRESAFNTAEALAGRYPFTARQMTDAMDEYRRERMVA